MKTTPEELKIDFSRKPDYKGDVARIIRQAYYMNSSDYSADVIVHLYDWLSRYGICQPNPDQPVTYSPGLTQDSKSAIERMQHEIDQLRKQLVNQNQNQDQNVVNFKPPSTGVFK